MQGQKPAGVYEVRVHVPANSPEDAIADMNWVVQHAISGGYDLGDTDWLPVVQLDGARKVDG